MSLTFWNMRRRRKAAYIAQKEEAEKLKQQEAAEQAEQEAAKPTRKRVTKSADSEANSES